MLAHTEPVKVPHKANTNSSGSTASPVAQTSLYKNYVTFEAVMVFDDARNAFKAFLRETHSEEPVLFYECVQSMKSCENVAARYMLATSVVEFFLRVDRKYELNLSDSEKAATLAKFNACTVDNCPRTLFDELLRKVEYELKSECFVRFLRHPSSIPVMKEVEAKLLEDSGSDEGTTSEHADSSLTTAVRPASDAFPRPVTEKLSAEVSRNLHTLTDFERWRKIAESDSFVTRYKNSKGTFSAASSEATNSKIKLQRYTYLLPFEPLMALLSHVDDNRRRNYGYFSDGFSSKQIDFIPATDCHLATTVNYSTVDVAWPLQDRDAVMYVSCIHNPDTQTIEILHRTGIHPAKGPTKNRIRMDYTAYVTFKRLPPTESGAPRCEVDYIYWINFKGKIPIGMWNFLQSRTNEKNLPSFTALCKDSVNKTANCPPAIDGDANLLERVEAIKPLVAHQGALDSLTDNIRYSTTANRSIE